MSDDAGRAGPQTDEERARAIREQLKSIHAVDYAYEMMVGLVSFGYQKMGLTGETEELRDLRDARLAIELLRATLGVVERDVGEAQTRDLHSTLAQMQLSYARAVQIGGGAESRSAERPAAEPSAAEPEAAPAAEAPASGSPAAESAAARKPAAKKPAAKKPAAKKPAAKKPAAKKTAAKKPAPTKKAPGKPGGEAPAG